MNAGNRLEAASPAALSEAELLRRLSQQGFKPEDRAAIRAFGRVIGRDLLQADFCTAFLARAGAPVDPAAADAEAAFCDELLNICQWQGDADWFNRLAERWAHCLACGVSDHFPWAACGALLSACRDRLVGGRAEVFQLEMDLLTGLVRAVWAVAAYLSEVTLLRERERVKAFSLLDAHTGLPNRLRFEQVLDAALGVASDDWPAGLVVLSLQIGSDAAVMLAGDRERLQRAVSQQLATVMRDGDVLCLTGEDEWSLVQCAVRTSAQVLLAAHKMREVALTAAAPICVGWHVDATAGGACGPRDAADAAALERAARNALFAARDARQPVAMYCPEVAQLSRDASSLEREFLRALAMQHFDLFLQPQIEVGSGACHSVEALLRWRRADGDWVAPPAIIELAERAGAGGQLVRALLSRQARVVDELARAGVAVSVMLNLTAQDVRDPDLPELVRQSLANWRVPAARVGFELTEGALLVNEPAVAKVVTSLREAGYTVALDDFGTGYSSLSHLRRLPVDELKIDRQFVAGVCSDPKDRAMVEALLVLAQAFRLRVVAEGVETAAQAACLSELGCDRLQGYFVARPMSIDAFVRWWRARYGQSSLVSVQP
ncbi:bifunctional diguanylate cyclase/phosphodiesterase [Denitromonas iodatirespirans]|uniref:GGDEF domain-containing protein n=1 Tax=Denitromonas iodatirespirans TaxID=2795389 RepID=A0A944DQ08_DENI1|nr:bifunctional diguanylate cyclase/phosphodiesterase [Denitromonas iodatirespirans]MBT0962524.1 GGDEF domain-containing protein [Denitromonas iodatirespirans]